MIFFCVGVVYSGEYVVCDVTLSVYPQRASLKNMPGHGVNRNITYSNRPDRVAQLADNWASIPKVVGSIHTVARHIFQARPLWIYTQSNITNIIFTRVHNTNTEKNHITRLHWCRRNKPNHRFCSEISLTRTDLTA